MKIFWTAAGLLAFALGTAGIVIPILPTVPFYMAAAFCFAKGSDRLDSWFKGTSLYRNHLESFVKTNSMPLKSKISVMITVTLLMAAGFVMMKNVPVGRIILTAVWVFHILYFVFAVKTRPKEENDV